MNMKIALLIAGTFIVLMMFYQSKNSAPAADYWERVQVMREAEEATGSVVPAQGPMRDVACSVRDGATPEDAPYVEAFCRAIDGNLYRFDISSVYGNGTALAIIVFQEFTDHAQEATRQIIETWATIWARERGLQLDTAMTVALEDGTVLATAVYPAGGETTDGSIPPLVDMAMNAQEESGERWFYFPSVNPLDGTEIVSVSRGADADSNTFFSGGFLSAECRSNTTYVRISWGKMSAPARVTLRIGGAVRTNYWNSLGSSSEGLVLSVAPKPIPLLREIVRADRLEVQASQSYLDDTVRTLVFDFSAPNDNTREAIERVAHACQWTVE